MCGFLSSWTHSYHQRMLFFCDRYNGALFFALYFESCDVVISVTVSRWQQAHCSFFLFFFSVVYQLSFLCSSFNPTDFIMSLHCFCKSQKLDGYNLIRTSCTLANDPKICINWCFTTKIMFVIVVIQIFGRHHFVESLSGTARCQSEYFGALLCCLFF